MNLNTLEKLARRVIKGEDTTQESRMMLSNGFISPTEHRSLNSLSWQIAANVKANNGAAAGTWASSEKINRIYWM